MRYWVNCDPPPLAGDTKEVSSNGLFGALIGVKRRSDGWHAGETRSASCL